MRDRQTDRPADEKLDRQTDLLMRDRQTNRLADERQTDRQTDLLMRDMIIVFTLTCSWRSAQACRKILRVCRWNSSGNTCKRQSG